MAYVKRNRLIKKKPRYIRKRIARTKRMGKTTGLSTYIKKQVLQAVSRNAENKEAYLQLPATVGTYTSFNNALTLGDFVNVMPNISQGTNGNSRIGNSIKLKGCYVKGEINITFPTTSGTITTGPTLYVRLMCLEDKQYRNAGVGNASILTRNGTDTAFQGYTQDLYTPIDRSRYIVHYDKVIKLHNPNMNQNLSGYYNSNIRTSQFFKFKLKRTGMLKYDSNTSYVPVDFCPQFAAVWVDPSQIAAGGATLPPQSCQYTLNSIAYYEDA